MAVKLVFSPRANEALEAISDYISRDNPTAAVDWLKTVKRRCNALRDMPYSGRRHGRTFRVVQVGNYQIVYTLEPMSEPETIVIVTIFHGARDIFRVFPLA